MPEENAEVKEIRDKVPYKQWAKNKHLTLTDGNRQDYQLLRSNTLRLIEEFNIEKVAIDPWQIELLYQDLEGQGYEIHQFGSSYRSWNFPTKELEAAILDERVVIQANPCMRWCFSNTSLEHASDESVRPTKKFGRTDRIDCSVASIQAFNLAIGYVQDNL